MQTLISLPYRSQGPNNLQRLVSDTKRKVQKLQFTHRCTKVFSVIFAIKRINRLVFVTATDCVLSDIEFEFINVIEINEWILIELMWF